MAGPWGAWCDRGGVNVVLTVDFISSMNTASSPVAWAPYHSFRSVSFWKAARQSGCAEKQQLKYPAPLAHSHPPPQKASAISRSLAITVSIFWENKEGLSNQEQWVIRATTATPSSFSKLWMELHPSHCSSPTQGKKVPSVHTQPNVHPLQNSRMAILAQTTACSAQCEGFAF